MNPHVNKSFIEYSDKGVKVTNVSYDKEDRISAIISALGFTEEKLLPAPETGSTGYLEVSGDEPEGYGEDEYKRRFVQFKVEKRKADTDWEPCFIRIFQRYPESSILVSCETGDDFIPSSVNEHQLNSLIEAIKEGKEVVNQKLSDTYWFEMEQDNITAEEAYNKDPRWWEINAVYLRRK